MDMLHKLRNTVNEHNKLIEMAKNGDLDMNAIFKSQNKFNQKKKGKWR